MIQKPLVLAFWQHLKRVSTFTRSSLSRSGQETGWNGKGCGTVIVTQPSDPVILLSEKGTWQGEKGSKMTFTNIWHWTLDLYGGMVGLEHLRVGPKSSGFSFLSHTRSFFIPFAKNKCIFDSVGLATNFLSSLAPCHSAMVAHSRQKNLCYLLVK